MSREESHETGPACSCCSRLMRRSTQFVLCAFCRNYKCQLCRDVARRLCSLCDRPVSSRNNSGLCKYCKDGKAAGEGPRPDDRPAIHYYHARYLAGLPLFTAKRIDR